MTQPFILQQGVGEAHSDVGTLSYAFRDHSNHSKQFHSFEDLVRIAAREADTVVPIVSFKEVAKGDWRRQLPAIVNTGLKRPPDFVLCTHMDQVWPRSLRRVPPNISTYSLSFRYKPRAALLSKSQVSARNSGRQ